jgi:hypothetical protein
METQASGVAEDESSLKPASDTTMELVITLPTLQLTLPVNGIYSITPPAATGAPPGGEPNAAGARLEGTPTPGVPTRSTRADDLKVDKVAQDALRGADALSAEEQQELATLIRYIIAALKSRRAAPPGTPQANNPVCDAAVQKTSAGETIVTNVSTTITEKQPRQLEVSSQKRRLDRDASEGDEAYILPLVLARSKLQRARDLINRADYDAAEALAQQAEKLDVAYHPGEDTPARVRATIARIRSDPRKLLSSARVAFQLGDLDNAERLARAADKLSGRRLLGGLWGDSPSRVLKDVATVRAKQTSVPVTHSSDDSVQRPVKAQFNASLFPAQPESQDDSGR